MNGRLIAIACSLFFVQQLSGINAIVYFSSSVFRDAGIPSEALASASVGVVNVLGTIIAASLMDKQGRKCAFLPTVCAVKICVASLCDEEWMTQCTACLCFRTPLMLLLFTGSCCE